MTDEENGNVTLGGKRMTCFDRAKSTLQWLIRLEKEI